MSQEQQSMTGINLLTQVVMPKLIERVKNMEAEMELVKQQIADLTAAEPVNKRKRKTKAEKEAEAKATTISVTQVTLPPSSLPGTSGDPAYNGIAPDIQVLPEVAPGAPLTGTAAGVAATGGNNANGTAVAGTAVAIQSGAAVTGDTLAVSTVVGDPITPVVIGGYAITGTIIQAVQYVMQQGFSDGPTIAQALGIPQGLVDYVLSLSPEQQAAIYQQFPPVPPVQD